MVQAREKEAAKMDIMSPPSATPAHGAAQSTKEASAVKVNTWLFSFERMVSTLINAACAATLLSALALLALRVVARLALALSV